MKLLSLSCLFCAFALLASVSAVKAQSSQAEESAIRDCFQKYKAAVEKSDGKTAAALISSDSIKYYGSILNLALNGDEKRIRQQHYYRKMMVLLVRLEAAKTYCTNGCSTNATEFYSFLVSRQLGGAVTPAGVALGKIKINEFHNYAGAQGILNGQETPATLVFQQERDGWKFDILAAILRLDQLMAEKQKQSSISEDDAIIQALEKRAGRPIDSSIWKPLRQK